MAGKIVQEIYCWKEQVNALTVFLASTEKGAFRIGLALKSPDDCSAFFRKRFPREVIRKDHRANLPLIRAVHDALTNVQPVEIPPLDISFTPFQWAALNAISQIPFGETMTYGEVASLAGRPKGARAVGQAMGSNPLPLLFP